MSSKETLLSFEMEYWQVIKIHMENFDFQGLFVFVTEEMLYSIMMVTDQGS